MGGFVGFDYGALPVLFKAYGIADCEWPIYLDKILILTTVASKHWNSEVKKPAAPKK